jgi:hypothetical protein
LGWPGRRLERPGDLEPPSQRRRSTKRLLGRPHRRSEPLSRRITQTGMGTARQRRWSEQWTSTEGAIGSPSALPSKGGALQRPTDPEHGQPTSVSAGQQLNGAPRRNRTGDPILTMEPPGAAVRTAIPQLAPDRRAKVIGSLAAKLCAHFSRHRRIVAGASHHSVRDRRLSPRSAMDPWAGQATRDASASRNADPCLQAAWHRSFPGWRCALR